MSNAERMTGLNHALEPVLGHGRDFCQESSILYLGHGVCCVLLQQSFDLGCLLPLRTFQCIQLRLYCCLSRNELVLHSPV